MEQTLPDQQTTCESVPDTGHAGRFSTGLEALPPTPDKLHRGDGEPLEGAATREELPDAARRYVEFVEGELKVPVELVGVGAGREHVLA